MQLSDTRFRVSEERARAVATAEQRPFSANVREILASVNRNLSASPARAEVLSLLESTSDVSFVVTGQQLGLFGGPLLTLYKAVTAVRVAEELRKETKKLVLPLFWLQGEDHDLEEICTAVFPPNNGENDPHRISLDDGHDSRGNRNSVGFQVLGPKVGHAIDAMQRIVVNQTFAEPVLDLTRRSYAPEATYQASFLNLLAEVFKGTPLLFFDSTHELIGPLRRPVLERALEQMPKIQNALNEQRAVRTSRGLADQVVVKDASPLFFYHPEGQRGPRFRLQLEEGQFHIQGGEGKLSKAELLNAINQHPERFSNSALLRPLFQDSILPVAAYVGGAAELEYLDQIAGLYELFELPRSLVIPRARFLILDAKARRQLEQLGLTIEEVSNEPKDKLLELALERTSPEESLPLDLPETIRAELTAVLARHEAQLANVDPTLQSVLARSRDKISRAIDGFDTRYREAVGRRFSVSKERIEKLRAWILPFEVPQERVFAISAFLARFGFAIVDEFAKQIEPFSEHHGELQKADL